MRSTRVIAAPTKACIANSHLSEKIPSHEYRQIFISQDVKMGDLRAQSMCETLILAVIDIKYYV